MDDKEKYLHWLEEMWDVQKFYLPGSTEREEKRKEEIREMFKALGEVAGRRVEPPNYSPSWEKPSGSRDGRPPEAPLEGF